MHVCNSPEPFPSPLNNDFNLTKDDFKKKQHLNFVYLIANLVTHTFRFILLPFLFPKKLESIHCDRFYPQQIWISLSNTTSPTPQSVIIK